MGVQNLLDARSLLTEPFSWAALKRALLRREVTIEDVARFMGLTTTVSLEPDPIPLDVKVVLFGDRTLYYLLAALDPDIGQHFKVLADFDDDADRSPGVRCAGPSDRRNCDRREATPARPGRGQPGG